MAFYDLLNKFNYIEANNLKALLPGFVVAQMEVKVSELANLCVRKDGKQDSGDEDHPYRGWYMENGTICTISEEGIIPWSEGKPMFIAYNDPLNTIIQGDEYYATDLESENPRLVQLIPGDEFMANCDDNNVCAHKGLEAAVGKGLVKLTSANKQSLDDWFAMDHMPNGDKGVHFMFIGK